MTKFVSSSHHNPVWAGGSHPESDLGIQAALIIWLHQLGALTSSIMNGMRGQMEVLRGNFQDRDGEDPLVWVGEESSLLGSDFALV